MEKSRSDLEAEKMTDERTAAQPAVSESPPTTQQMDQNYERVMKEQKRKRDWPTDEERRERALEVLHENSTAPAAPTPTPAGDLDALVERLRQEACLSDSICVGEMMSEATSTIVALRKEADALRALLKMEAMRDYQEEVQAWRERAEAAEGLLHDSQRRRVELEDALGSAERRAAIYQEYLDSDGLRMANDGTSETGERRITLADPVNQGTTPASAEPIGYAVRMEDGPFVGIWQERAIAEHVCKKQPAGHNDKVIAVYAEPNAAGHGQPYAAGTSSPELGPIVPAAPSSPPQAPDEAAVPQRHQSSGGKPAAGGDFAKNEAVAALKKDVER